MQSAVSMDKKLPSKRATHTQGCTGEMSTIETGCLKLMCCRLGGRNLADDIERQNAAAAAPSPDLLDPAQVLQIPLCLGLHIAGSVAYFHTFEDLSTKL